MNIIILGLSITSSWGNGHATTYRSLVKGLHKRGHRVLFLERDVPWYSSNRDMPDPEFCHLGLYNSVSALKSNFSKEIEQADAVIIGSFVPDGIEVANWVMKTGSGIKAFYDIDTPVTLARLRNNDCEYLSPELIPRFSLYLSFSAGPCLDIFEYEFGSPAARQFYCSVDPEVYHPLECNKEWDLGYLGTYSDDRQPVLNKLLIEAARKWEKGKFIVAGPKYPKSINWPQNVRRIDHLPAVSHNDFYNAQKYTLNVTRKDMVQMGYSPGVRLFEAAACGIPVISDNWAGLETIFKPGEEILISASAGDTLKYLTETTEKRRKEIGEKARKIILSKHTGEHRAQELEHYLAETSAGSKFKKEVEIK